MKIAIIDDEAFWRECAVKNVKSYYSDIPVDIDVYNSGTDFLKKEKIYDIVLMDIEMPEKDGFDTIAEYRLVHDNCVAIILTTHTELSNKGYLVNAFRYIDKTNMKEELEEALSSAGRVLEINNTISLNAVKLGEIKLVVKDILFIETEKRNVLVHTNDNEYECSNSISELEEQLEKYGFYRSHRSFLVNLDKVKKFDRKWIYFAGNKKVFLSSRKYTEMKSKYVERKISIASM